LHEDDLRQLREFPHLQRLTLEARDALSDEALAHLADLAELQRLSLCRTRINGTGLVFLKKLPALQELDLSYCRQLAVDSLVHLAECQSLGTLSLDQRGNRSANDDNWRQALRIRAWDRGHGDAQLAENRGEVGDEALMHLGRIKSLHRLSLRLSSLTDAGLASLQGLQQLEELDLSYTAVSGDGLRALATLPKLKRLVLDFTYVVDEDLAILKDFPQLVDLSLRGTPVGDVGVTALAAAVNLRRLNLDKTVVTDLGLPQLEQLSRLEELHLAGAEVTFKGASALSSWLPQFSWQESLLLTEIARANDQREIVALDLRQQVLSDDDLERIADIEKLRALYVSNSTITDQGLAHLSKCHDLDTLDLKGTEVTDEGLVQLGENRALKTLIIDDTAVTLAAIVHLLVEVHGHTVAESLTAIHRMAIDNSGRKVDFRGLDASVDDLKTLQTIPDIRTLFVDGNQLNDEAASIIAANPSLEAIWLEGGTIGNLGVGALATLPELRHLWLTRTKLSDDALLPLDQCPRLTTLNLSGWKLTPTAISNLPTLSKLRTLIVGSLDVDDAAIAALTRRFPQASVITSQRDAIALMRELPKPNNVSTITAGPEDLRSRFGEDHFEQAVQLNLNKIVPRQGVRGLMTVKRANVVFADGISSVIADLAILPNLTAVSLYGSSFADEDMECVVTSSQLEELDLQRTTIGDVGLERVGRMLGLKHLSLGDYSTQIHDEGLAHLAGLVQLERLDLNRTDITDAGLIHLMGMRKLKELELRETNVDAGLLQLTGLSQLERIDLSSTDLSDATAISLAAIKSLKHIDVSHTRVTSAGARSLKSRLPELQISPRVFPDHPDEHAIVLELEASGVRLVAHQNGRVAEVDARDSNEPRRVVELVGGLPQVIKLRLGSSCADADLEAISAAATIVDLNLSDAQVSDNGVAYLQGLPHLRSLILNRTAISDAVAEHLVSHRELVLLWLAGTAITDSTLGRLAELPQLKTLLLDNTKVTGRGFTVWQSNAALKELYVRNISTIAEHNLDAFQRRMPNCQIIRTSTR